MYKRVISQEPRWISEKDSTWQESLILTEHEVKWLQMLLKDHETMTDIKGGSVMIEKRELHILQSILVKLDQTLLLIEAEGAKTKEQEE